MGKHGKNTTGRAEKLKAKARAKRKLLKKATARVPARPPKPAATTFNDDDEHVVKYAAPAPAAYGFKSVNGTGETGAVESNDVDEDEWN